MKKLQCWKHDELQKGRGDFAARVAYGDFSSVLVSGIIA